MKKIILFAVFIAAFQFTAKSQNCGNFCVLAINNLDTVGANMVDVVIYNGDTNQVNYPTVVVVNMIGDTVANKTDYFNLFAMPYNDTTAVNIPTSWDSIPTAFTGTVYLYDRLSMNTCSFAYPMACTVGMNEYALAQDVFTIFPNPSTGDIHLFLNCKGEKIVSLYDVTGKKVRSLSTYDAQITLAREELPKGLYFVSVVAESKQLTKKIILE